MSNRYGVSFEALSPLLAESGQSFERRAVDDLAKIAKVYDLQNKENFLEILNSQTEPAAFYFQTKLEGQIGQIKCQGIADLIRIKKLSANELEVTIIDIKSSRRESTNYRLQVAFYGRLLNEILASAGFTFKKINGSILLANQEILPDSLKTFSLALYADEIERIVGAENSDAVQAANTPFAECSFHLRPSCDGCPYNAVCFVNAAETKNLSLIPKLKSSEKRALLAANITRVQDLASFFEFDGKDFAVVPQHRTTVEKLGKHWALAGKLAVLSQRAKIVLRQSDKNVVVMRSLRGSGFGSLPDTRNYPDLVRVFLDTQTDYLQDNLYLLSAVIVGPNKSAEVCEIADAPPNLEDEESLLIRFTQKLMKAIYDVAQNRTSPLHFYLFDQRGQDSLLNALVRHIEKLDAIPAFHDLLTQSPALSQGMISFLAQETSTRLNLSKISQNLYEIAKELRFNKDAEEVFPKKFRARIFDNIRPFVRDENGLMNPSKNETDEKIWLESAARFGTQIPLEYAYAAWGKLPETTKNDKVFGFLGVSADDLKELAILRCQALRHIEEFFPYKSLDVEKTPLDLSKLDQVEITQTDVSFSKILKDFLYLEHHASRQEKLLHFSKSPDLRVETGRTAILRCDNFWEDIDGRKKRKFAEFSFCDLDGNATSEENQTVFRFRKGDWMILNNLRDEKGSFLSAKRILHGVICVVDFVTNRKIRLEIRYMNFKNSAFRYTHGFFEPNVESLYTIDEMADDLNSDKFLAACETADLTSEFYRRITDLDNGKSLREIRPARLRIAKEFADLANEAQSPKDLTETQRRVIGETLREKVLVLQGPPGTGKSHTLGFAVLARIAALAAPVKPFRVFISAKTHAAVNVALQSIAKRKEQILQNSSGNDLVKNLRIGKICNDEADKVPAGVEVFLSDGNENFTAAKQWDLLETEPVLIIGGTPGGLFTFLKKGAFRGKQIEWAREYFDLVIIDEASQMGIAEALTAAAFLNSDGQFIAVGDHRQMPPILAHAWDAEQRRDLEKTRPHLSIFEYLRESGFPSLALDRSFRIPPEVADFLNNRIYAADGVNFHSQKVDYFPKIEGLADWLEPVLAAENALVLIEHAENISQQSNEFEADLVEQIVNVVEKNLEIHPSKTIGIVVPHRAQKALLQNRLPQIADSIDTVERFQGGERDLIIISATVSEPEFAELEMEFLLDPRRLNVAVSRPLKKVIVIASQTIFGLIPLDLDDYQRFSLWKYLVRDCRKLLWQGKINSNEVKVKTFKGK